MTENRFSSEILDLRNIKYPVLTEENIVEYVLDRFENLKMKPSKNDLVIFHTNNKFLLMSHNQDKLRLLGNIVANHQKKLLTQVMKEYEVNLKQALSIPPTTKQHINTLMHIFDHFSKDFNQLQKELFLKFLEQFREGKITLGAILWEIESLVHQYNKIYLAGQTYFLLYAEKRGSIL
jgi:uncharacterized protein YbgA (DUF1722 family)